MEVDETMADQGYSRHGGMQGGRSQNWQQASSQDDRSRSGGGTTATEEEWKQGARGEWTGPERRVGINYNYTGPERREDEMPMKPREQTEPYGQSGGIGAATNTSERGHFGSGGTGGSMSGGTSGSSAGGLGVPAESDRGGRVGPERPHDEDIEDQ